MTRVNALADMQRKFRLRKVKANSRVCALWVAVRTSHSETQDPEWLKGCGAQPEWLSGLSASFLRLTVLFWLRITYSIENRQKPTPRHFEPFIRCSPLHKV